MLEQSKSADAALFRVELATGYALSNEILSYGTDQLTDVITKKIITPVITDKPILSDGAGEMFNAFKEMVNNLSESDVKMDCKLIGKYARFGDLCPVVDDTTTIDTAEPTSLSNGLYITTTNVGDR